MKFIVDAQLPGRLCRLLKDKGFDALHTLDLPLQNATSDADIIALSQNEDRIVVTKDSDFLDSFLIHGVPPKLILVRTGNISNDLLMEIFENNLSVITQMMSRSRLIEISKSEIAEHK